MFIYTPYISVCIYMYICIRTIYTCIERSFFAQPGAIQEREFALVRTDWEDAQLKSTSSGCAEENWWNSPQEVPNCRWKCLVWLFHQNLMKWYHNKWWCWISKVADGMSPETDESEQGKLSMKANFLARKQEHIMGIAIAGCTGCCLAKHKGLIDRFTLPEVAS